MATNPMIPQGTLNRVRASITFPNNTQLNITAPFLGKEGISTVFEGQATLPIETMSGIVTSPEPYQMITASAHMLRSQNLSNVYMSFLQQTSICGDFIITPDSSAFPTVYVNNGFIKTTAQMLMNGTQADYTLEFGGYWIINNQLWSF